MNSNAATRWARTALSVLLASGCVTTSAQSSLAPKKAAVRSAESSVEYRKAEYLAPDGQPIVAQIFSVNLRRARIEVFGAHDLVEKRRVKAGAGLGDLADAVARNAARPVLVVSGGNILSLPDAPLGWLVSDGRELAPLDTRASTFSSKDRNAERARECQAKADAVGRRIGGVFCVGTDTATIELTKMLEAGGRERCRQAIQSLPVVVHPADAGNGICRSEIETAYSGAPVPRSVVCTGGDGRVHFVLTGPSLLYPLAEWLRSPKGLGCTAALNLIGDFYLAGRFQPGGATAPLQIGNLHVPQASIVVVTNR